MADGNGNNFKPNRLDTNIERAYTLPSGSAAAIEWLTLTPECAQFKFEAAPTGATNTDVIGGTTGTLVQQQPVTLHDPVSVVDPKEGTVGPQTLHQAFWYAAQKVALLNFIRGSGVAGSLPICPAGDIPSGDVTPYVSAFGDNSIANVYPMPEGLMWGSNDLDGGSLARDSQLGFQLQLLRDAVIPITLPAEFVGERDDLSTPVSGVLWVKLRCGGYVLEVGASNNSL